ncbi:MAG: arginine--tRNA ligase [Victivallales bacterium]|nr:arginine--tRNA ligase [Victivallales bacterium]
MKFAFEKDLHNWLKERFGEDAPAPSVELCPEGFSGDVTVSCFPLAKPLRQNPMKLAGEVGEFLAAHADVKNVEVAKAFVNLTLDHSAIMRDTVAEEGAILKDAVLPEGERRRILIEFSAPNTNKPQHLGHVRNNAIGMCTASILKRAGHDVVQVNLVNDRGIHICKSMIAYQRFGENCTPESTGKKGDHLVGDFYVRYNTELERQIAELRQAQPELAGEDKDALFLKTEIGAATAKMLQDWEAGEPEVRALWEKMNKWVFDGFAETYKRMGISFDQLYLESETYKLGKDIVTQGLEKGVFKRREDGAVIIDFDDKKLGSKVVLRSDGTSVYITQDMGTTLLKQRDFQPDQQMWVVGDEQIYHFQVLFSILKALGYSWADKLVHMAYGMVNLPTGKMKSREGTVVDADDLFDEMANLARTATLERVPEGGQAPEDLEQRAAVISMAALKFMLLKVNPRTTIMFDPNAAIKFEGDTGPYVLYAYARISSMLRQPELMEAAKLPVDWSLLEAPAEKRLALRAARYPEALCRAAREYDSSALASYLLDLGKDFSAFYNQCPVKNAATPELRAARAALSKAVRDIIGDGLHTMTIETLESM